MATQIRNSAERAKAAEKHMKAAQSAKKGGWFSKADHESAARYYIDAVEQYKGAGDEYREQLFEALTGASESYAAISSEYDAATNAEKAADLLMDMKDSKRVPEAVEWYKRAAENYALKDNAPKAAAALVKAGKCVGNDSKKHEEAKDLFKSGLQYYSDSNKGMLSDKAYKEVIAWCVEAEEWDAAAEFCRMQNKMVEEQDLLETFAKDVHKNHLSIILMDFHLGNYGAAKNHYSEALAVTGFSSSSPGEAADGLMLAYRNCDEEEMEKARKHAQLKYLPAQLARLARKLKLTDERLAEGPDDPDADFDEGDDGPGPQNEDEVADALE